METGVIRRDHVAAIRTTQRIVINRSSIQRAKGFSALKIEENGVRVSIGIRNSHDKSCSVGITIGYRVFVCDNLAFHGGFQTLTRKHSKNLVIEDVFSVAIDRMQRNFAPMLNQVNAWKGYELPDAAAKLMIYRAFIEDVLPAPKHLAKDVHRHYFEPEYEEFQPRTMWSLSNAFTSAFKALDPVPRFRATAKLAPFLDAMPNFGVGLPASQFALPS